MVLSHCRICLTHSFHHGAEPSRKSVSVQGPILMLPSAPIEVVVRASDRGAGPRTTLPFSSYCEPWHGQMNLFAAFCHGTVQPKCVHTAPMPKFLILSPSSVTT